MSRFRSFREFYPYYLAEHSDRACRRLHFVGSTLVLATIGTAVYLQDWRWLVAAPVVGYGFAWIGHFFFEHNKPATFHAPVYSLMGDWRMWAEMLVGRIRF